MSPRLIPCFAPDVRAEPSWGWRAHDLVVVVDAQWVVAVFASLDTLQHELVKKDNFNQGIFTNTILGI